MRKGTQLVRFDWAMKRLLRDKANFVVLEGFLTVLLNEKITIKSILSSQSNQDDNDDKYNDVDVLIEDSKGELVIIEVQNTKQHDYFHRILFGSSKVITEYINEGEDYDQVRKVISITVAYFDLGQGKDYVYHGTTSFTGLHHGDTLTLSDKQKDLYRKMSVRDIYPEYWIIKAGLFDENQVNDKLDEWIYFLKTGRVGDDFTAPGLSEAKVRLDKMQLTQEERRSYDEYVHRLRSLASTFATEKEDVKDAIKSAKLEGKLEGKLEAKLEGKLEGELAATRKIIIGMGKSGIPKDLIASITGLTISEIEDIIGNE